MVEVSTPAPVAEEKPVYVKAKRKGYYNGRRRNAGEIFRLNSMKDFSDANRQKPYSGWMALVKNVSEDFEEAEGYITHVKNEGRETRFDRGDIGNVPNAHLAALAEEQKKLRLLRGGSNDEKPQAQVQPSAKPTGDQAVI